jgi:hypothetical protein
VVIFLAVDFFDAPFQVARQALQTQQVKKNAAPRDECDDQYRQQLWI